MPLTETHYTATTLKFARQDCVETIDNAINNAERLVKQLRESKAAFTLGTPETSLSKQADTFNEAINHIENFARNVNYRDWARRQAALTAAREAFDKANKK